MIDLLKGRYRAKIATSRAEITEAQKLRFECFASAEKFGLDRDQFDDVCHHVLVKNTDSDALVCCFRLLHYQSGADISSSYAAQFYDLSRLIHYADPMIEIGRFCIKKGVTDPNILRVAWGVITRFVDENRIGMLFGCSSFRGTDPNKYYSVFSFLRESYLAPASWAPEAKAARIYSFEKSRLAHPDTFRIAMKAMPPLLRTYLLMGGRVSDHAVIDEDLDTLHVFTGLKINAIPARRKELLRSIST